MMRRFLVALAVLGTASAAAAQQPSRAPSPIIGELVADRMCSSCHRISARRSSEYQVGAPSFAEIAGRPDRDAAYLRSFTSDVHIVKPAGTPPMAMSTSILTPEAREDVIAYILAQKAR